MDFLSSLPSAAASRPTLFELVAQAKLHDALSPAVRYVVATIAQRYPRHLLRALSWHEEIFAASMLIVETHYLKIFNGSFTENFYGFKRVRALKINRAHTLTQGDVNRSLVGLLLVPYVKRALDEYYRECSNSAIALFGEEEEEENNDKSHETQPLSGQSMSVAALRLFSRLQVHAQRLFRLLYPWIQLLYQTSHLVYQIAYTYGISDYYSPVLHLLGLRIVRLTMADHRSQYDPMQSVGSVRSGMAGFMQRASWQLLNLLKIGLPLSVVAYKFLEWWHTTDFSKQQRKTVDLPAPPQRLMPHPEVKQLPASTRTCPLCDKDILNPAALPTGYVFCYTCIFRDVEKHHQCPVTRLPARLEEIRKIYETGS